MKPLGHEVEAGWFFPREDIYKQTFYFPGASLIADSPYVNEHVGSVEIL